MLVVDILESAVLQDTRHTWDFDERYRVTCVDGVAMHSAQHVMYVVDMFKRMSVADQSGWQIDMVV